METTPDRAAAAVKSGSTVFSVQQQQSRQRSWRVLHSNTRNKAPAKVINMNVSEGNSKEIFELFNTKLVFSVPVCKDEESDEDPDLPSPH